ncbi:hypothetical protein ACHAWF_004788 [Thalassiosira exigua]
MAQSGDDNNKRGACTECHRSKNKCKYSEGSIHCDRCIRLGKECVPHLSRQGKRKQRLTVEGQDNSTGPISSRTEQLRKLGNYTTTSQQQSLSLQSNHNSSHHFFSGPQPQRRASSTPLSLLLSRALNNDSGNNLGTDGSNTNVNGGSNMLPQNILSQAGSASYLDPTKLNMMINHLTGGNANANSTKITDVNAVNHSGVTNYNVRGGSVSTGSQPSSLGGIGSQPHRASALLMLAGTSSNHAGHDSTGNGVPNDYINMNTSAVKNEDTSMMQPGYNEPSDTSCPASNKSQGRRRSMGHGPLLAAEPVVSTERRSSLPLGIGGGGSNVYEMNQGGMRPPKKQKRSQILPSNQVTQNTFADDSNRNGSNTNSHAHLLYASIPSANHKTVSSHGQVDGNLSHNNSQRSSQDNENTLSRASSASNLITPEDAIGNHIARVCAKKAGQELNSLKNHYGLQCQIREWISMALIRRSFLLLSKAVSLANRCGIHMDMILCGVSDETEGSNQSSMGGRMNYLLATLLEPRSQQVTPICERRMRVPHLPKQVISITGCQGCPSFFKDEMRNRWIIIRQTHRGITQFYCSPAFERNVLCWKHISQIYEDNLADINSLIFVKDDFRKFLLCNAHQISLHHTKGMMPKPVHAYKTKIRLLGKQWGQAEYGDSTAKDITKEMIQQVLDGGSMMLDMDLRFVSFPTMDKTTYFLEFFHHSRDGDSSTGTGTSTPWARNLSDDSLNKTAIAASQAVSIKEKARERIVSESPAQEAPPAFDDVIESEDWVGINDVLASGDIDDLITALLD